MLDSVHILLTYRCTSRCDHCFLYCSPDSDGTFTLEALSRALAQIRALPPVESVCFEGGEPFLYYPLLIEGIRRARAAGLRVGVVTNAYFATSVPDAELWLAELRVLGIEDLSISEDELHGAAGDDSSPGHARAAAARLGLPAGTICLQSPSDRTTRAGEGPDAPGERSQGPRKGEPVTGGGVMYRGRAVETLLEGLARRPACEFTECPHEDLISPGRVHLDAYGHVHLCQGLSMGNIWSTPLPELLASYDPLTHPVVAALVAGGPFQLARESGLPLEDGFVDACHLCFEARRRLLDRFPAILAPRQVYGEE